MAESVAEQFVSQNVELFGFCQGNILVQTVKELLDNSHDACNGNGQGKISICITLNENFITISITDNGRGMVNPQECFSCFQSHAYQDTRIGKYGLGLSVTSYFSFQSTKKPILLASRCAHHYEAALYEIVFDGACPVLNELPNNAFRCPILESGTVIELNILRSSVQLEAEVLQINEYATRLQYGSNSPLAIDLLQSSMYGPTQCMSVSSPFNASYLKEENPAPVYLEWLSQVLPHFQFLNFELGKTSNTADSNVEVHAVACQANEADNLRNEILDAPDVVVPIKLWTFVNGKPLDSTLDCAVTRQISLLKQLPGYIRLCKGQSVEGIHPIGSQDKIAFQDMRKKSVAQIEPSVILSIQNGVRNTLLNLISNSFLSSLIINPKNSKDMYLVNVASSSIARSVSKWLSATEDEDLSRQLLKNLGASNTEEAQEIVARLLLHG